MQWRERMMSSATTGKNLMDALLGPAASRPKVATVNVSSPQPMQGQQKITATAKMIALLSAKGVGIEQVAQVTGINLESLKMACDGSSEAFDKLVMQYSVKLNQSDTERIKQGSELALSRVLSMLADPNISAKDLVGIARDLMDRQHGKATQKIEYNGMLLGEKNLVEIEKKQEATNKRLGELLEMRQKVIDSNTKNRPPKPLHDAQVIDISTSGQG
jgi:hypothetical protein